LRRWWRRGQRSAFGWHQAVASDPLDAAMVVATDALLAARGWAENNFPRTMQAIAERLGGGSYESAALETGSFRFPQVEREGSGGDQV